MKKNVGFPSNTDDCAAMVNNAKPSHRAPFVDGAELGLLRVPIYQALPEAWVYA
ncbi:hypothetical protein EDD11_008423, partial [Mortierella claussenii]